MTDKICFHCIVSGRVQGVWFRSATHDEALALGLTGWVRNLPEGQVEVLACGPKDKLKELHDWLKKGPVLAKVEEVRHEEVPWESHEDFVVRR